MPMGIVGWYTDDVDNDDDDDDDGDDGDNGDDDVDEWMMKFLKVTSGTVCF